MILTGLLGSAGAVWADAQSDFDKGYAADEAGDFTEAAKWYSRAAVRGHADAQHNLGVAYDDGKGNLLDSHEAVYWWSRAAKQGYVAAQYRLGQRLARGSGDWQDISAAYMWLTIAVVNGHSNAIGDRDDLENRLSDEQLKKANERARRCMEYNYKDCGVEAKPWWRR